MRILLISDIHANLVALQAVLEHAKPFDAIWCLGDVVGYGPDPNECIETLKQHDSLCLAGNHDWAVLDKVDLEEFNPDARRAAEWTRAQLTPANLAWLHGLPERVPTQFEKFTLVHGSPRYPIWEYVLTAAVARINFDFFDTHTCFVGHTHQPVIYRYDINTYSASAEQLPEHSVVNLAAERIMLNPGSVGQPRDGDPRSAFAVIDLDDMTLTHHRVEYDIRATQEKMEKHELPLRLVSRLSYGW